MHNAPRTTHGIIKAYPTHLPLTAQTPDLTLGEGSTPLVHAPYLSDRLDAQIYLKLEWANPTGSFKDRGMVLAVAKALEQGSRKVICASTGNTSASAAAYAARAGLQAVVVIPAGKVAAGKLAQAAMYAPRIVQVHGNFDAALALVRDIADRSDAITLVNSLNPHRIAGQATAAFEIVDALGAPPDIQALPVGNAGNITAYWSGYNAYRTSSTEIPLPRMFGFQASGAAPLVLGHRVDVPTTVATAIAIGNPASGPSALTAAEHSGGSIRAVTDSEILDAYHLLAAREGIFVEPASAASVAGLLRYGVPAGSVVVATLTGNGLKDPDVATKDMAPLESIDADPTALRRLLGI